MTTTKTITSARVSWQADHEQYSEAITEARETFANVYHDEITPYTELCWGLSRLIGTEPAQHVPSSRWHNALCSVTAETVMDLEGWVKAITTLHIGQMKAVVRELSGRAHDYSYNYVSRAQRDLDEETSAYIDREIKRAYPKVRRGTKRYKELYDSVKDKARERTAEYLTNSAQHEIDVLDGIIKDKEKDAEKIRSTAYALEQASAYVLRLCPAQAEAIGRETRLMLDTVLEHARELVRPWTKAKREIQRFVTESYGQKQLSEQQQPNGQDERTVNAL